MKDICVPNYFQSSEDDEEVQALVDVMCMHANVLHKMGVSQENKHSLAQDQIRIVSGFYMHATMQEIKVNKRAMETGLGCYSVCVLGGEIHSVHATKNYGYLIGDIIEVKGGIKERFMLLFLPRKEYQAITNMMRNVWSFLCLKEVGWGPPKQVKRDSAP